MWRTRMFWFGLGMAAGTALAIWNVIRLGYIPWNSTY